LKVDGFSSTLAIIKLPRCNKYNKRNRWVAAAASGSDGWRRTGLSANKNFSHQEPPKLPKNSNCQ